VRCDDDEDYNEARLATFVSKPKIVDSVLPMSYSQATAANF